MLAASLLSRELQQSPAFSCLKDTNLRNQQQPLNTTDFRTCTRSPHPLVGRPGGRPTPSTGRPGGRPGAQQRVGSLQSVDRAVDRAPTCARCAPRSTGPVDRVPDTLGGRTCFLLLLLFSAAVSFAFSSSTSLAITSTTPRQSMSISSAIFSLSNNLCSL